MDRKVDAEVSLFVRDRDTGRLVFNSEALRALGLSPVELKQRGYALKGEISSPAVVPDDGPVAG
jgi:PAS domain-containing protein